MINSLKRLAPMGKSMSCIVLIFAAMLIVIPLYKSMEIDFEAVFGCLILSYFWWLLGRWHENEVKKPFS